MIIKGMVVSGRACTYRFPTRCFIAAHDAKTGKELWRFNTTAGEGEPGGDTWGNLPNEKRIHVSPWGVPGSYDPELNLIYWGLGVPGPYTRVVRRGTWDVGDRSPCELYSNSTVALEADTGKLKWYYQHLPCDDWDADFVHERTLINTVVNPDPEAVLWINPEIVGNTRERKVVVSLGEPGGLFVNDRETGEFLWADPLPYDDPEKFVIRDIDVNTGTTYINMDLVAKDLGQSVTLCGHNVKSWWSWSYSPLTGLLYIPFNRTCLQQTANADSATGTGPRVSINDPSLGEKGPMTDFRAINISTGREVWRFTQRSPHAGSALATGGNLVFFGDLNRRLRAFDAETGKVLWKTIVGSHITGYPVTYAVGGRQYLAVPVGGGTSASLRLTPELKAPSGSNMIVTFALPE
jgi:alcohol dehydrogenase (cytochrome c)